MGARHEAQSGVFFTPQFAPAAIAGLFTHPDRGRSFFRGAWPSGRCQLFPCARSGPLGGSAASASVLYNLPTVFPDLEKKA